MIYIYTHAYNATKDLARSIESVLNQTHRNFIYHLCDNGSTDDGKTRDMILRYAERDKRIVPELRELNHLHPNYKGKAVFWLEHLTSWCKQGNDDDFFCTLDADDEYKPDFFEKTLRFIDENNLDAAACGSDLIDTANNEIYSRRNCHENIILDSADKFDKYLELYHKFMRPVWGKLYRFSLIKRCDCENYINSFDFPYGVDTLFCMRTFSRANRVGILEGTSHRYYISRKSSSNNFDAKRVIADQALDTETRSFLIGKAGKISARNDMYLKMVYYAAVADTLNVLLRAKLPFNEKIKNLRDIFTYEVTKELFNSETKEELVRFADVHIDKAVLFPTLSFLLYQKECRKPEGAKLAVNVVTAMFAELPQLFYNERGAKILSFLISKMPEVVERLCKQDYAGVLERLGVWLKRHDADDPLLTELELAMYQAQGKSDAEVLAFLLSLQKKRPKAFKKLYSRYELN